MFTVTGNDTCQVTRAGAGGGRALRGRVARVAVPGVPRVRGGGPRQARRHAARRQLPLPQRHAVQPAVLR